MRTLLKVLALSALLPLSAWAAKPASNDAIEAAINQQLNRYEQALNSSDVDRVMMLYADDAVFMPQQSFPAVGRDAVRTAYLHVFDTIKLDIRFVVDEVRPISRDWAFARTRSNGTIKVLRSDQPAGAEANQELFLLHREADGQWRIARYIFSTTNPPKQP
jgi:uncharacterized protein (TIGR02246 family)